MNPQDYNNFGQNNYGQDPNFSGSFPPQPQQYPQNPQMNAGNFPQNQYPQQGFGQPQNYAQQMPQLQIQQNGKELPQVQRPDFLPNQQYNTNHASENPYTIEYLNKIAPKETPKFWTKTKVILVISIFLMGIGALVLNAITSSRDGSIQAETTRTLYHLSELKNISQKYKGKLKSSEITALNAEMIATFSSDYISVEDLMISRKYPVLKPAQRNKSKLFTEITPTYDKIMEVLDTAFLNSQLDSVYAREMSFQLSKTAIFFKKIQKQSSKSAKETYDPIIANFESIITKLDNFSKKSSQ